MSGHGFAKALAPLHTLSRSGTEDTRTLFGSWRASVSASGTGDGLHDIDGTHSACELLHVGTEDVERTNARHGVRGRVIVYGCTL